jgi:hypothetical protein
MSLREAINAKCKDCCYDPRSGAGTWRAQAAQCGVPACPLWPVRPAPSSGPYANPPRDPSAVPPDWLRKPLGWANPDHQAGSHD